MTASRKASEVMSEPIDKRQPQRLPIVLNIKVIGEMCCKNQSRKLLVSVDTFIHYRAFNFLGCVMTFVRYCENQ
jgi:hypothetical protein